METEFNGPFCWESRRQEKLRETDSACLAHEGSERNKDSIRNWARGHSCDSMIKNLVSFYPCLENLSEVEFKRNGIIRWRIFLDRKAFIGCFMATVSNTYPC